MNSASVSEKSDDGFTALHFIAKKKYCTESTEFLISQGVKINEKDGKNTLPELFFMMWY
ncbi:hypothetical protein TVAG_198950 [Trichomonas vaginalis G3]|uniref:Uncharacterized protein n=1 Tax=Trichomonas vaginalis (strain ATCC PRA-98 / G3) TaxID=412133 RepID=A2DDT0_TRIV3|nr:Ankyrin repeat family [Trichomonas vaginalis G3]EAY21456.1 hypothetical protein TVAG_198950 [Trichomonas vaginalis G3]KAI5490669.1 Ankyrin repeat family [Trichomonas vaginalis G3]|eukprot:XP_001582442.1 hypothetical protein [Trichomonas vaginalis G3]